MKASELIAHLAQVMIWAGDQDVCVIVRESDGYEVQELASGPASLVHGPTHDNAPFVIVAQNRVERVEERP